MQRLSYTATSGGLVGNRDDAFFRSKRGKEYVGILVADTGPMTYIAEVGVSRIGNDEQDLALGTSEMGWVYSPLATSEGTGATCIEVAMEKWTPYDNRIEVCPTTGCWLWMCHLIPKGYGIVSRKEGNVWKERLAHRVCWEENVGPIPDGMVIDHICKVRCCVNPDHLRVKSWRLNAIENSDGPTAQNAAKKCCPKCGGDYTRMPRNGNRECIPCRKANKQSYYRNNKHLWVERRSKRKEANRVDAW